MEGEINISKINSLQEEFFNTLTEVQDKVVNIALCNYTENDDIENLLYDVTYETIYNVMELIDGYTKNSLQLDLIVRDGKESIRKGIELHDTCSKYLKHKK